MMTKIKDLAEVLASKGRGKDSLLAHINPREAQYLKDRGGSGVRNPRTGILEFDDGGGDGGSGDGGSGDGWGGDGWGGGFGGFGEGSAESGFGGSENSGSEAAGYGDSADATAAEMAGDWNSQGFGNPAYGGSDGTGDYLGMSDFDYSPADMSSWNTSPSIPATTQSDIDEALNKNKTNDFTSNILSFVKDKAISSVLGNLGIPGMVASPAMAMASPNATPNSVADATVGSLANFATMGMFGLAKGLGSAFGMAPDSNQPGNTSGNVGNGSNNGMDLGGLLQGLSGLYMGNRASGQYNNQLSTLNDLYSPNSPYAQQLRQQLERRDAAAGRRSQYGNRETELMANLAQAHGQALTSPGYNQAMGNRERTQNQGLGTLLSLMQKSGGLQGVGRGLQGLFGGGSGTGSGAPSWGPAPTMQGTDYGGGGGFGSSNPFGDGYGGSSYDFMDQGGLS